MKNKILDLFLSAYKKETQFLDSFELVGNKGTATFITNSKFYSLTKLPVDHFTAVELQICLNQLLFIYFAHLGLFDKEIIPTISNNFIDSLAKNNFITEQITHFKKDINPSEIIRGEIEVLRSKKIGNVTFMDCRFQFGEGCFGTVKVAHKE